MAGAAIALAEFCVLRSGCGGGNTVMTQQNLLNSGR